MVAGVDLLVGGGARARPPGEGGDEPADLARGDEQHRAELPDGAEAVGDEGEVLDVLLFGGDQQADREAVAGAESGDGDGGAILEVGEGLFGTADDLISHGDAPQAA